MTNSTYRAITLVRKVALQPTLTVCTAGILARTSICRKTCQQQEKAKEHAKQYTKGLVIRYLSGLGHDAVKNGDEPGGCMHLVTRRL